MYLVKEKTFSVESVLVFLFFPSLFFSFGSPEPRTEVKTGDETRATLKEM